MSETSVFIQHHKQLTVEYPVALHQQICGSIMEPF